MSPHSPTCPNCANFVAEPASGTILGSYCFAHAFAQRYSRPSELHYCPSCDDSEFFRVDYRIAVPDLTDTLRECDFSCSFSFAGRDPDEAFYCDPDTAAADVEERLGYILRANHPREPYFWRTPDSRELSNNPAHLRHSINTSIRDNLSRLATSSLTLIGDYGYCEECGDAFNITD